MSLAALGSAAAFAFAASVLPADALSPAEASDCADARQQGHYGYRFVDMFGKSGLTPETAVPGSGGQ